MSSVPGLVGKGHMQLGRGCTAPIKRSLDDTRLFSCYYDTWPDCFDRPCFRLKGGVATTGIPSGCGVTITTTTGLSTP